MFQKNVLSFFAFLHLAAFSFCQHTPRVVISKFPLGSSVIRFQYSCFGSESGVVFVNLHENESTSVAAGRSVLDSTGRFCMAELKAKQKRLIDFDFKGRKYTVDPNRIFTRNGAAATLQKNNGAYPEAVLRSVLQMARRYNTSFIDNKKLVVALHNNSNGDYSILSYQAGGEYAIDAEDVFINKAEDPDDFFYTTEQKFFEALKSRNRNVVLQHSKNATDDGSLSVYCAAKHIPYINIEAEQGNLAKQKEMMRMVLELIAGK